MLVSDLDLPAFDHTDGSLRGEAFHAALAQLASTGWLARGPFGYITLDREAGDWFLRTRQAIFPGMKIAEIFGVSDGPLYEEMARNILHINGADHSRLRGLVNPALSPRAVERYRPLARDFFNGLLDEALGESPEATFDFVQAVSRRYPSQVIATVMGAPLDDAARLYHWSTWIQKQFDAVAMATELPAIEAAVAEFYDYASALVAARRGEPGDDLVSRLVQAEEEGDRLTDVECVNLVFNILVGGVDTTQAQLAHTVRLLAEHRGQWAKLRANPALAAAAVEEALRYEPITPFTARIALEEITYRDVTFPADTIVMVCSFTANRDLGAPGADRFEIDADRGLKPLTFGAGVHYCMGANLARVELTEAISCLAERADELELAGDAIYESISGIYGLESLALTVRR